MAEENTTKDPFAGLAGLKSEMFGGGTDTTTDSSTDDVDLSEMDIKTVDPEELVDTTTTTTEDEEEVVEDDEEIVEDTTTTDTTTDTDDTDGGEDDAQAKLWGSLTNVLESQSIFSELDEEAKEELGNVTSEVDLLKRFEYEKQKAIDAGVQAKIEEYEQGETKELIEFIEAGGTAKDFVQFKQEEFDWTQVDRSALAGNENAQATVVVADLRAQGVSDDKIRKMLKSYQDSGILEDQADIALDSRVKAYTKTKEAKLAALEKQKLDNLEASKKIQSAIKKQVLEENIGGFTPVKSVRKKFLSYIQDRDKDGLTGYERKEKELTDAEKLNRRLILQFLDFHDFNFDKLAAMAKSKATSQLETTLKNMTKDGVAITKSKTSRSKTKSKSTEGSLNMDVLKGALGI